ncbi:alpha-hydroxy-acid oxidizing protein [Agromyces larvae]|uniref:Alpha-hydroxy-acid oxidizing protein n=1 Tax=Agromyces larvae TaxID=2929802 RepID=A0ABY4BXB5_9MICO|nr:alpha-hydroxy-acid oxidizing protein [Agromyces larvae]UOE43554.1 alpha-hydroxy-acid oxidizing protein [Agromyces larvae]
MARIDTSRGYARGVQSAVYRAGIAGARPAVPTTFAGLEQAAERTLSAEAFAYLAGGAGAEHTMAANTEAFGRWQVVPRVLRDVAERDLSIELLGRRRATPLVLSPLGVMELAHPDADVAVARAAAALDVPYVLSNQASRPMEEVAAAMGDGARWFQLYWSASDELNASFLRRAEASGCEAIVVTLDTHLLGWRTRDLDLAFLPFTRGQGIAQYTSDPVFAELVRERVRHGAPADPSAPAVKVNAKSLAAVVGMARGARRAGLVDGGLADAVRSPLPRAAVETFLDVFADPSLTWDALAKVREWTDLPVLLKGIVHPDDAERAVDAGMDGIVVSNHGGRQIDRSVPTVAALPAVVERVAGRVPVLLDSGVRGGADVAIALSLGATAVGLGRPYAYGLAIAGASGVSEVVRNTIAEFDVTLGLAGCTAAADLGPDVLRPSSPVEERPSGARTRHETR